MDRNSIALGIITKYADCTEGMYSFIKNAKKHGHIINKVIISYSHGVKEEGIHKLKKYVDVELLPINESERLYNKLKEKGIEEKDYKDLLLWENFKKEELVPYGIYRNNVLLWSIITGIDFLFFIDTDVFPFLLEKEKNIYKNKDVDYFGRHLSYLNKKEVICTTSDYSGYYIIPPMNFDGLEELLKGVQKEDVIDKVKYTQCLVTTNASQDNIVETNKILGGNVAIKVKEYQHLAPFFSTSYSIGKEFVLTRGEDTLLGLVLSQSPYKCIDIDTKIFHNTFGNFPNKPEILKEDLIKDRFYYACLGWIGRNPFLNWLKKRDVKSIYEYQRECLVKSSSKVSTYLKDERFNNLPQAIDIAYKRMPLMIEEYERTMESYYKITKKI